MVVCAHYSVPVILYDDAYGSHVPQAAIVHDVLFSKRSRLYRANERQVPCEEKTEIYESSDGFIRLSESVDQLDLYVISNVMCYVIRHYEMFSGVLHIMYTVNVPCSIYVVL